MKKVKVRCWKEIATTAEGPHTLYVTYPEGGMGHELIVCRNCGQIYAVDVALEQYVGPPIEEKLRSIRCNKCDSLLSDSYLQYPDSFVTDSGLVGKWIRPSIIPNDSLSVVMEFDSLY